MSALEDVGRCLRHPAWMRRGGAALAAALLAWAGCQTAGPSGAPAAAGTRVDELDLVTTPVAVNLESKLGITGIQAKVFALDFQRPKAQPLGNGSLEVLMFEGLVGEPFDQTNRCRHIWSFPARDLVTYASKSTVGVGYLLPLNWGKDQPRADKITVVARFIPPQGRVIYSAPSYIPIPPPSAPPSTAAPPASPQPPPAK